jgi:biopolymer transport protein ExbB
VLSALSVAVVLERATALLLVRARRRRLVVIPAGMEAAVLNELRRRLWILGTIGATAPFVGLFGTVVGIIRAFSDIAASGTSGFEVVAVGIGEALVATAAGIVVAVVAVVANNALQVAARATAARFAQEVPGEVSRVPGPR